MMRFFSVIDTPRTIAKPEKEVKQQQHDQFYPKEINIPDVWLSSYKENKIEI